MVVQALVGAGDPVVAQQAQQVRASVDPGRHVGGGFGSRGRPLLFAEPLSPPLLLVQPATISFNKLFLPHHLLLQKRAFSARL